MFVCDQQIGENMTRAGFSPEGNRSYRDEMRALERRQKKQNEDIIFLNLQKDLKNSSKADNTVYKLHPHKSSKITFPENEEFKWVVFERKMSANKFDLAVEKMERILADDTNVWVTADNKDNVGLVEMKKSMLWYRACSKEIVNILDNLRWVPSEANPNSNEEWKKKLSDLCVGKRSAWKTADEFQDMWNGSYKMHDTLNYTEECIEKQDVIKDFAQTKRDGESIEK